MKCSKLEHLKRCIFRCDCSDFEFDSTWPSGFGVSKRGKKTINIVIHRVRNAEKLIFEKFIFGTSTPSCTCNIIEFKDVISRTSPNYERLWSNACWYVEYWNHIRMVHHEFYRIIIHYHNYVTLSKYSCKTNSTDNVWFYLNTLPSGSVARSGSRPMDYIYQWLFSVVCILESRKKGHKSRDPRTARSADPAVLVSPPF